MNNLFIIFLLVSISCQQIDSFKPDEFCKKFNNIKCFITLNRSYECGKYYCSINKKSCDDFLSLGTGNLTVSKKNIFMNKKKIESIKNCKIKGIKFSQWSNRFNF
jgi:hypothetical protein